MNSDEAIFQESINHQWEGIQTQNNSKETLRFLKDLLSSAADRSKEEISDITTTVIKYFTGQIIALFEKSHNHTAEKATQCLEHIVHTNPIPIARQNLCEFYNAIGTFFRKSQKISQALRFFEKGVVLAEKLKKTSLVHCYLNLNLCGVLAECKRYLEAIECSRKSITYSQELLLSMKENSLHRIQVFEAVCISYHSLGIQEESLGNLESAIEWHEKSLKFAVRHLSEDRKDLVDTLSALLSSLAQQRLKTRPSTAKNHSFSSNKGIMFNIQKGLSASKLRPSTTKSRMKPQSRTTTSEAKKIGFFKMPFTSVHIHKAPIIKDRKKLSIPKHATYKAETYNMEIAEEAKFSTVFDPSEHEAVLDTLKIEPLKPNLIHTDMLVTKAEILEEESIKNLNPIIQRVFSKTLYSTIAIQTDFHNEACRKIMPLAIEDQSGTENGRIHAVEEAKFYESAPNVFLDLKDQIKSKTSSIPESRSQILHKALVKSYKIDLLRKEYEIKYFINSSLDTLYILASNDFEKYTLHFAIDNENSILDIINDKIHPFIDIVNEELVLVSASISSIFEGIYVMNNAQFLVRIEQTAPRCDYIVTFQKDNEIFSKKFSLFEMASSSLQPNIDNNLLFCCFCIDSKEIKIEPLQKKSLKLIYFKPYMLSKINCNIKISKACYTNRSSYLIEVISCNSGQVKPLLIDGEDLSRKLRVEIEAIPDKIAGVAALLVIEDSQVCFFTRKENTFPKGLNINTFISEKMRPKNEEAEEEGFRYNSLDY